MVFLKIRSIGFEPITVGTEIRDSIQLSYKRDYIYLKQKMIQQQTIVRVSDNSGAKVAKCIKVLGGFKKRNASVGDLILVAVSDLRIKSKKASKIKKGGIYKALVIRSKKNIKNYDESFTLFNDNAVSLLNKQNNPIATRIFGPVSKKLEKSYMKFVSISAGTV